MSRDKVNIRPGVSVLSVLRHLNYKPWFALAEFVDNSLQSGLSRIDDLKRQNGDQFRIKIYIDIQSQLPGRISIRDNACGISLEDFPRAFKPASVPSNRSGLSEFGMGMKSAACWFAANWYVRTKFIGSTSEHTITFDIDNIVNNQTEELFITSKITQPNYHYTEIVLENLHHIPVKKTVSKIKEHLSDIYRNFIRSGELELYLNNELLKYEEPLILNAPYELNKEAGPKEWKKTIEFDFGEGMKVTGFAALRDPGNYNRCGFALFRRNRLIQGSGDEGYKPLSIYSQLGSYRSLRLFGELHLEGFDVSHTKDGFRWDENEEPFLEILKEHLDAPDLPLLKQADKYRALEPKKNRQESAQTAVDNTTNALEKNLVSAVAYIPRDSNVETEKNPLFTADMLAKRELSLDFEGSTWHITIEVTDDPSEGQWLVVSDHDMVTSDIHTLEIRVSLNHPFMIRFTQKDIDSLDAVLRIAAGLAVSEKLARMSGVKYSGTIRRNLNELLRNALADV